MIITGGSLTTLILFIVVYAALIMRYRGLPKELKPSKLFDIALGLSGTSIAGAGLYAVIKLTLT